MPVTEAVSLRLIYRTSTGAIRPKRVEAEAVRGISFSVERGKLFALLEPNGAGKTTTRMLITLAPHRRRRFDRRTYPRARGLASVLIEEQEQRQLLVVESTVDRELTPALLAELDGPEIGRVSTREPALEDA